MKLCTVGLSTEVRMIARRFVAAFTVTAAIAVAVPAFAQKPATAPKNATGQCRDGSYSAAKTERGACSRHGGVKAWWGATTSGSTAQPSAGRANDAAASSAARASAKAGGTPPPPDATGQCTDGTYTKATSRQGACAGHGGVATWLAAPPPTANGSARAESAPSKSKAAAPENATAKCKDGTYSFAATHRGACSRHGGVAEWYK
jgi:hypothetical protein